jgi:hypothetical protein
MSKRDRTHRVAGWADSHQRQQPSKETR